MKQNAIFPDYIDRIIIDSSRKSPGYIAISRNKKHIQLSPPAYALLEKVALGNSFADIAEEISARGNDRITAEEIQKAYETVTEKIKKIDGEAGTRQRDFWLKISLFPAPAVLCIASRLTFLFHPLVAFALLSCLILLAADAMEHHILQKALVLDPVTVLLAYLLFLVSLLLHEFGHSSACVRGGIAPSEIGAAVYLVFPVFYSDVSASWQLSCWRKVRVDTGGVYFQLFAGTLYLFLLIVTRQPIFQAALAMVLGSCFLSLNPFFKFDGYWVLTDLLDIPNLYKQPLHLAVCSCQILRKQRRTLPWPPGKVFFITLYGLLKAAFWLYFLALFLPLLWHTITTSPALVVRLVDHATSERQGLLLADLQTLLTSGLFMLFWVGGLCRICIPYFKKLKG